jgi:hypothetical protein
VRPPSNPVFNQHNVQSDNIFHDLEGPDLHNFGIRAPAQDYRIGGSQGGGIRGARFHKDDKGKLIGVVKGDANSFLKEPLVHHIGEHIQPGLIPKTVIRNYENPFNSQMTPHSLQEFKPGKPKDILSHSQEIDLGKHPKYANLRAFDWLVGNNDRHGSNVLYDEEPESGNPMDQVHGIDNGGAFDYGTENMAHRHMRFNETPFSPDFREGILNADENYLSSLFDRVKAHPAHKTVDGVDIGEDYMNPGNGFLAGNWMKTTPSKAKNAFLNRLGILKEAMSETDGDAVLSPHDLYNYVQSHPRYKEERDRAYHDLSYGDSESDGKDYDNSYGNTHNNTWNNTGNHFPL